MTRMVRVAHDGVEKPALVPETALPRMTSQGWRELPDEAPAAVAAPVPPAARRRAPRSTGATPAPAKKPGKRATSTQEL